MNNINKKNEGNKSAKNEEPQSIVVKRQYNFHIYSGNKF